MGHHYLLFNIPLSFLFMMTNQHPLTDKIPLNYYPYEKTMISPLDKACDDQRDAFQESISEAHKLGCKTGRDEQLEQVMEWLKDHAAEYVFEDCFGAFFSENGWLLNDLKKAMRPQEDN